MANDKEHRDVYIAFAVGGVGLVLILLYLLSPGAAVATQAGNAGNTYNDNPLIATQPPGASDYNYNVPGFDPGPPIQYTGGNLTGGSGSGSGSGCGCDAGGVTICGQATPGSNINTAQFLTLLGANSGGYYV